MTHHRHRSASEIIGRKFPTRNDLPADAREPVVELLNRCLADTTDLLTQAKFAHWNVKGQNFYQLHLLFDELAETLGEHQDLLAERATALGGQALGTVRMAADNSAIPEFPTDAVTGDECIRGLADNLAIHAENLRRDIDTADGYGDEDTMDLFIEVSREVDKFLWFLDAHLQAQPIDVGESAANSRGSQSGTQIGPSRGRSRTNVPVRTSGGQRYASNPAIGRPDRRTSGW